MIEISTRVKKYILIGISLVIILVCVLLTVVINNHSYDIQEIAEGSNTESTESTEKALVYNYSFIQDLYKEKPKNASDKDFAVLQSMKLLMNSPLSASVDNSSFEVKEVNKEFVVMFSCSGFEVYVTCTQHGTIPYIVYVTKAISKEEETFFLGIVDTELVKQDDAYVAYVNLMQ